MGRPSNTVQRRAEIVEGLMRVIADHGYDGASIPDIAHAAGVAPGIVHYHFGAKLEILVGLAQELVRRFDARLERYLATATTPDEAIDAFVDAHLRVDDDSDPAAVAAWVVIAAEALRHDEVREVYVSSIDDRLSRLEALCLEARRCHTGSARGARAAAAAILAAIEGAFGLAAAAPDAIPPASAATTVRKMAHAALAA